MAVPKQGETAYFFWFMKNGHTNQAFRAGRPAWIPYKAGKTLSGSITPAHRTHPGSTADRAPGDILFPDSQDQLRHGHSGKTCLKTLVPLDGEDKLQVSGFGAVVQEAVVTDFLETMWEHMKEETPYELAAARGDGTFRVPRLQAPCGKGHFLIRKGKDTAVGDGDLMGIPAQVLYGIAKAIEGLFDERAPVSAIKTVPESLPAGRFPEGSSGIREGRCAVQVKPVDECRKFSLKLIPQDKDREEKCPFASAYPAVRREAAPGEDAVHMHMVMQFLVPGMEHLDDAGLCTQVFSVGEQLQQRLRAAPVEKAVKGLLVGIDEWVELMRECKDHMKIRGR